MRTSLLGAPLLHLSPRLGLPCASREMPAHHLPASRVPRRVPLREWDATAAFSVCPHTPQWPQPSLRAPAPASHTHTGTSSDIPPSRFRARRVRITWLHQLPSAVFHQGSVAFKLE